MDSKIGIKFTKSYHMSSNTQLLVEYEISETANQSSIVRDGVAFPPRLSGFKFTSKEPTGSGLGKPLVVTVKLPDDKEVGRFVSNIK